MDNETLGRTLRNPDPEMSLDLRARTRIGTWNVLSMKEVGSSELVGRELSKLHLSITALTEVRWPGAGESRSGDYSFIYSGRSDGKHMQGVALALSACARKALTTWTPISERLMSARFKHRFGHLTVIACYAPTNASEDDDKQDFYTRLADSVAATNKRDLLFILGDLNASVGTTRSGYELCLGPHGHGTRNDNGERLLEFCLLHGLKICGSYFKRKDIHKITWYSNDGHTRKELDHIITNKRWNLVQNCRTFRSAEFGNTDHRLVVASCKIHLKRCNTPGSSFFRPNLDKLADPDVRLQFLNTLQEKFADTAESEDIEDVWAEFKSGMMETAKSVLGKKVTKRKPWISQDTLDTIEARREARLAGDMHKYRELSSVRQSRLRKDKETWARQTAEDAQAAAEMGNTREVYVAIRKLSGKSSSCTIGPVVAKDGSVLPTKEEQLARWRQYYEELLNKPPPNPPPSLDDLAEAALPDPSINIDPPTTEEIRKAVLKLKNGKAPGLDGIPPELLKQGGDCTACWLHKLFTAIWNQEKCPEDWKKGIILPFYKNKGSRCECKNHRGITLLSVPAKVFAHVLLNRIKEPLVRTQRPEQSGFTPGRSTVDRILALRLLAEKRREFREVLMVAYVDLKAAFDSVDRPSLWKILKIRGVPDKVTRLIQELYNDTQSCVRIGADMTDWFSLNSGVRQGCVLAPTLFSTTIDHIMGKTVADSQCGVSFGHHTFTDLDYADDVAILAESTEILAHTLEIFSEESQRLGLEVSWLKTKLQTLSDFLDKPSNPEISGEVVEVVDSFVYLGSTITSDCKPDSDVRRRIALAAAAFASLSKIWASPHLSRNTKIKVYETLIISVLLYGAEAWTLTKALAQKLDSFDTQCLRKIEGVRWYHRITNEEIRSRTETTPVSQTIYKRQVSLIGHLARATPPQDAVKLITAAPSRMWKRPRGRPRQRWDDVLFTTLDEVGIDRTNWRTLARERTFWRQVVRSIAATHQA